MHPFAEGVSALQIYCMKEGVKVQDTDPTVTSFANIHIHVYYTGTVEWNGFSSQDVCIPDLIKLLDILGDNGVNRMNVSHVGTVLQQALH